MTPDEEVRELIMQARLARYIPPKTEVGHYIKKLEFLRHWIDGYIREQINQYYAKEGGYGWCAYHIGTRDFEYEWKIETGEIQLYA